jgi:cytochrome bd-type quinol oxidase subunit 2
VPGRRVDLLAAVACLLSVGMLVAYLLLVHSQSGSPAVWAVAVLVVAVAGTAYATSRRASYRRRVLVLCAVLLVALGFLAILSIGLPILLAGLLCMIAAARFAGPAPG